MIIRNIQFERFDAKLNSLQSTMLVYSYDTTGGSLPLMLVGGIDWNFVNN